MNKTSEKPSIDILCVIDEETILKRYPNAGKDADHPVRLDQKTLEDNVRLITRADQVLEKQASWDMEIKAGVGDTIRWRVISIAGNADIRVEFYKFAIRKTNQKVDIEPSPSENGPWEASVRAAGKILYYWYFKLIDRGGDVNGYFYWEADMKLSGRGQYAHLKET